MDINGVLTRVDGSGTPGFINTPVANLQRPATSAPPTPAVQTVIANVSLPLLVAVGAVIENDQTKQSVESVSSSSSPASAKQASKAARRRSETIKPTKQAKKGKPEKQSKMGENYSPSSISSMTSQQPVIKLTEVTLADECTVHRDGAVLDQSVAYKGVHAEKTVADVKVDYALNGLKVNI
jgi:hypothetical protein